MPGSDHHDTSADYEQFEKEPFAQDRGNATARSLVDDLVDATVVTPVPEDRVLVHEPSSTSFELTTQLAGFHRGWTAGRDADVECE